MPKSMINLSRIVKEGPKCKTRRKEVVVRKMGKKLTSVLLCFKSQLFGLLTFQNFNYVIKFYYSYFQVIGLREEKESP
jgi:hypothetical protein